jgi:hypothetical protein
MTSHMETMRVESGVNFSMAQIESSFNTPRMGLEWTGTGPFSTGKLPDASPSNEYTALKNTLTGLESSVI